MSIFINDSSEEIYEKNTHLLCTDPKETIKAGEVMNEAVKLLKYHATSIDDYELCDNNTDNSMLFYNKRHQGYINVEKIEYKINNLNKYNELVNQLWDPDSNLLLNKFSVKRKIVRLYSPNLVMIQHRCKIWPWSRRKYFYALAAKYKVRKTFLSYFVINHIFHRTIIVMASADINDHTPSNKEYKNANLFKTDIDSEDYIKKEN
ncbi:hypothetical protein YYC_01123 [Plasmodium yoelii 17X]|uniref:Fam-a protein n=1 Tax=Plasmodium yoelii 17X TaxID=1323249 RepID=V7PVE7_PLAYE|nr:hypothetical protein YYC_01123 [Plasmodium yoelii 17X]